MNSHDDISEGGSKIVRHAAVDRPRGVTSMGGEALEAIDTHLNTFIGNPDYVIHEIFSELLLSLPKSWTPGPLWETNFDDESRYWPIRLLASLARLPHEYDTWLGPGHTIPNGDPPEPYAPELIEQFVAASITETIDPKRRVVGKKRFLFF